MLLALQVAIWSTRRESAFSLRKHPKTTSTQLLERKYKKSTSAIHLEIVGVVKPTRTSSDLRLVESNLTKCKKLRMSVIPIIAIADIDTFGDTRPRGLRHERGFGSFMKR